MQIQVDNLKQLPKAATEILNYLKKEDKQFVIFQGQMGAGKTTLIAEIVRQMGIEDVASSPTFSIVNEYFSVNYGTIYHFDFYRIEDESEALDIGVEEIFEEDAFVFIEWPERIENLLPEDIVCLKITEQDQVRTIEVTKI